MPTTSAPKLKTGGAGGGVPPKTNTKVGGPYPESNNGKQVDTHTANRGPAGQQFLFPPAVGFKPDRAYHNSRKPEAWHHTPSSTQSAYWYQ